MKKAFEKWWKSKYFNIAFKGAFRAIFYAGYRAALRAKSAKKVGK